MSEWTPRVGDRVMVGEHGPYYAGNRVIGVVPLYRQPGSALGVNDNYVAAVPSEWLSPAPEPEPEEPTAPGALVRDGNGVLWAREAVETVGDSIRWLRLNGWRGGIAWEALDRPVTVVLADPAEVEQLRAEVEGLRAEVEAWRGES